MKTLVIKVSTLSMILVLLGHISCVLLYMIDHKLEEITLIKEEARLENSVSSFLS